MEQEEGNIPGVIRRLFLRRDLTLSSLNFQAMERQKGKGKKRSGDMPSMFTLF
jgi:hypothetical protein